MHGHALPSFFLTNTKGDALVDVDGHIKPWIVASQELSDYHLQKLMAPIEVVVFLALYPQC